MDLDNTISARAVARRLGCHRATVVRWIKHGLEASDDRVYLDGKLFGSQWRTTEAALASFFDELTEARLGQRKTEHEVRDLPPAEVVARFSDAA